MFITVSIADSNGLKMVSKLIERSAILSKKWEIFAEKTPDVEPKNQLTYISVLFLQLQYLKPVSMS